MRNELVIVEVHDLVRTTLLAIIFLDLLCVLPADAVDNAVRRIPEESGERRKIREVLAPEHQRDVELAEFRKNRLEVHAVKEVLAFVHKRKELGRILPPSHCLDGDI